MTYATITLINLWIVIIAAILYFLGLILTMFCKEKHKRKIKLIQNVSLKIAIAIWIISAILIAYKASTL